MELPKLHPNAAGIDIGTEELWVAVPPDRSTPSIRMFYSFTNQLQELVRWLKECRIDTVAIESTGGSSILVLADSSSGTSNSHQNLNPTSPS